jgi:hypothetical protein
MREMMKNSKRNLKQLQFKKSIRNQIRRTKRRKEEEKEEEEENPDGMSYELQQLLFVSGNEK